MGLLDKIMFFDSLRRTTPITAKFDVFLSYNIADIEVVKNIFYVLSNKGLKVYLDIVVDPDMKRSETDKQTAERIHTRLMNSNSLLYAQSPSAGHSNWMPWELGVVDGHTDKCFVLPVTKDTQKVSPQREYLTLYPYVALDFDSRMKIFREDGIAVADYVNFVKQR